MKDKFVVLGRVPTTLKKYIVLEFCHPELDDVAYVELPSHARIFGTLKGLQIFLFEDENNGKFFFVEHSDGLYIIILPGPKGV